MSENPFIFPFFILPTSFTLQAHKIFIQRVFWVGMSLWYDVTHSAYKIKCSNVIPHMMYEFEAGPSGYIMLHLPLDIQLFIAF